jgi:hypothetical protein
MLLLLPVVSVQGPAHTVPLDAFNILFIGVCWCIILARRESVSFPLILPFGLIMLGSCVGLYAASEHHRALLVLTKEVYLYAWFVTAVHFLSRRCRTTAVLTTWVAIAGMLAFLMIADFSTGVLGGQFGRGARAAGTFENPNMCGSYLVMSFFLAWAAAGAGRRRLYLAMPVLVAGLLSTASNGAMLSFTVGCIVTGAAHPARRSLAVLGTVLVVAAVGFAVVSVSKEQVRKSSLELMTRGRSSVGGTAVEGASERFPIWMDAAESLRRVPTGVGPGNFNREGGPVSGSYHGAHNEYVGMLTERGPLGFAGWCALLAGVAGMIGRLRAAAAAGVRPLAVEPLFGALAAAALHATTTEFFHFRHFWMFMVVIFATVAQVSAAAAATPSVFNPSPQPAIAEGGV